ncbi:MAG: hypothetical protein LC637_02610 [Xanthomonadaceae bacterium]|nr:hypothetical protein [Xanthomonadaceae bacterium]
MQPIPAKPAAGLPARTGQLEIERKKCLMKAGIAEQFVRHLNRKRPAKYRLPLALVLADHDAHKFFKGDLSWVGSGAVRSNGGGWLRAGKAAG